MCIFVYACLCTLRAYVCGCTRACVCVYVCALERMAYQGVPTPISHIIYNYALKDLNARVA